MKTSQQNPVTETRIKASIDHMFDPEQTDQGRSFWQVLQDIFRYGLDQKDGSPVWRLLRYYHVKKRSFYLQRQSQGGCQSWWSCNQKKSLS
ncbi:MAG: hypothetical protein AAFR61_14420 [Bacteroidota bacterium]